MRIWKTELLEVLDTGICNDVMEAYAYLAMKKADIEPDVISKVMRYLPAAFDTYTAREALTAYRKA